MQSTFTAFDTVVRDLIHFVFRDRFGSRDMREVQPALTFPQQTGVRSSDILPVDHLIPVSGTVMVRTPQAYLYHEPVRYFDGIIATVPYGTTLSLIGRSDRWYHVVSSAYAGWLLHDDVIDIREERQCIIGSRYDAADTTTQYLRTVIGDAFGGQALGVLLQDIEYVLYRLHQAGKGIVWPQGVRPRIAGSWQRILKGAVGVHMTILPRKGSVMELLFEDGTGHVAFVDDVYADESILISEVGYPEEGYYNERVLPKEEWREFRPVFIEVADS